MMVNESGVSAAQPVGFVDDAVTVARDPAAVLVRRVAWLAEHEPDRPYLAEVTGDTCSYGTLWAESRRWAAWLQAEGVAGGSRVVTMLPPSIDAVAVWLGLSLLQAREVPVNPELTGTFLEHVLDDAAPVLCLVRPEFAANVTSHRGDLNVREVERRTVPAVEPLTVDVLPGPDDIACVIYTSGTTGPAKGVVLRWAQFSSCIGRIPRAWLNEDDAVYACHPTFHVMGRTPLIVMADVGGRVVCRERFSASAFLADVRAHGCTITTAMAAILLAQPERDDDSDNPLRIVFGGHHTEQRANFAERFATVALDAYGSTEVGFPLILREPVPDGSRAWCGRLRPGYTARVVDADGNDVTSGAAGEMWIRPQHRSIIMKEYLGQPDATDRAFVGEWFRTGDLVSLHADGNVEFLDRMTDTIRRHGENISASAVEAVVENHPDVAACAVLGVRDAVAGHEVLLLAQSTTLSEAELYDWLHDRVPRYARPRYVMVTGELPRTPTGKVRKTGLADTVDLLTVWSPATRNQVPRA